MFAVLVGMGLSLLPPLGARPEQPEQESGSAPVVQAQDGLLEQPQGEIEGASEESPASESTSYSEVEVLELMQTLMAALDAGELPRDLLRDQDDERQFLTISQPSENVLVVTVDAGNGVRVYVFVLGEEGMYNLAAQLLVSADGVELTSVDEEAVTPLAVTAPSEDGLWAQVNPELAQLDYDSQDVDCVMGDNMVCCGFDTPSGGFHLVSFCRGSAGHGGNWVKCVDYTAP